MERFEEGKKHIGNVYDLVVEDAKEPNEAFEDLLEKVKEDLKEF